MLLPLQAQTNPLTVENPTKVNARRGEEVSAKIHVKLQQGFHVNSNKPAEDYLIPLRLTWDAKPLQTGKIQFPEAKLEKHSFSNEPVSVYTSDFFIETIFKVPTDAAAGLGIANGKLRYQACTDTACYPPKTIEVKLPFEVR